MTAINHALTGAFIGLVVGLPVVALPLAIVSHFICDAIPHYGSAVENEIFFRTKRFKFMLLADAFMCISLVSILASTRPNHWLLACTCAFLATSPDLLWIGIFLKARRQQSLTLKNRFLKFAAKIQWFEKPIGVVVELVWFAAGCLILDGFVR